MITLAKVETTYGVDPTPTEEGGSILIKIKPIDFNDFIDYQYLESFIYYISGNA